MESPLQVDDPMAHFRVHCPACRQNVWAGFEEPPAAGDEVLADHDCPGPVDIETAPEPQPVPRRSLRAVHDESGEVALAPDTSRVSGYPVQPAPPFGGPEDSPRS